MRIRITFSKDGAMQYVGHLDLHKSWERSFRRSGLPLTYSLGFHPQPRLNLACALPLGFTSQCELIDAWLGTDLPTEQVHSTLAGALPPGITLQTVTIIDEKEPATQTQITSAVYRITFLDQIDDLEARLQRISRSEHLPRTRRGKDYDLRPLIESLDLLSPDESGNLRVQTQLAARDGNTGRPEELLDELGVHFEDTQIHREMLILKSN